MRPEAMYWLSSQYYNRLLQSPSKEDVVAEAKGFSKDNLYRMGQFYRFYSEQNEIVAQVVPQIEKY